MIYENYLFIKISINKYLDAIKILFINGFFQY